MNPLYAERLLHMTAAYSNALLLVVITNVSDFARKLDLPLVQPITASQVLSFRPHSFTTMVGGWLTLTNGHQFWFEHGRVHSYRSSSNYFVIPDGWEPEDYIKFTNYWGRMNMTTNEVIAFARNTLLKLGYDPKQMNTEGPPTAFEGPFEFKGHTIPQCHVEWNTSEEDQKTSGTQIVNIYVNAETKQVIQYSVTSTNTWRPDPKLGVVPELEVDYQKRTGRGMFIRSNAPPRSPAPVVRPVRPREERE
jgi:hypothetical protein